MIELLLNGLTDFNEFLCVFLCIREWFILKKKIEFTINNFYVTF